MLYHPDKHRDPELKIQAEQLFNQVHQAYEGKGMENKCVYWIIVTRNCGIFDFIKNLWRDFSLCSKM